MASSSNSTPPSQAPHSNPTPLLEAPNPAPAPPSAEPGADPAPQPEVSNTAPTPPSAEPNVDPAPQPELSNTTTGTPSVDPAPQPEVSNTGLTPSSGADSAAQSEVPNTTPTPPSQAPDSGATPPEVPKTTPTPPPAGAPGSSPTSLAEAPSSGPTPTPGPNITQKVPPQSKATSPTPSATPPTEAASTTTIPEQPVEPRSQKLEKEVFQVLETEKETTTITLHGETGVGKTWMAREIFKMISHNMREAGDVSSFCATLWLSLNRAYQPNADRSSRTGWFHVNLLENLARQLCVLPPTEGGFEDDDQDEAEAHRNEDLHQLQENQKGPEKAVPQLGDVINEKLRLVTKSWEKPVVLALDGVPENMNIESKIISQVEPLKTLREKRLLRVIAMITTKRSTSSTESDIEKDHKERKFLIEDLKEGDFLKLLETSAEPESLNRIKYVTKGFKEVIFGNSGVVSLPAAVAVAVGKALKHNFREGGGGGQEDQSHYSREEGFENFLKEVEKQKEKEKMSTSLIRYAFDTLPSGDAAMIKCCWHSRKFFELIDNAAVHYNELIAHWIMEGSLDHFRYSGGLKKAYEEGYRIFEELLKRGLLKVEDEDFVAMEGLALKVFDHRREGFDETAMLGLPDVFQGDQDWQGLGRIAVADGMIKSVCRHKKWRLVSTLMIEGSRLNREVPGTFFKPMEELQVLVLLNPTLKSLDFIGGGEGDHGEGASPLSKLRMLVLRGCEVLENVDSIKKLESLTVLEISGANSLKILPDDLFEKMSQLRSLNLSESQVEYLPSSFSNLTKLRWLILRRCSNLKQMPSLKDFVHLQVLDMCGCSSLTKFRDKKFGDLVKLRVLDLSQAKIAPLPFVHTLHGLTRLTLKGCSEITRLPHLEELPDLQVLELSGSKELKEFYASRFRNKKALRVLDLSKTGLGHLPSTISDLISLVELDLSRMSSLEGFEGVSFDKLACLQSLNLSNTNVKSLPSLSGLKSLRQLLLSDCRHLEALPEMEGLTSLEILDLSHADELKKIPDKEWQFLKLRQLLLPNCEKLEKLPILKSFPKLEVLNLSSCKALEDLGKQSFQEMRALEVLDLSATKVQSLPSLSPSSKLRRLLLEKCTELGEIPPLDSLSKLEELNLCGAKPVQKSESEAFHLKINCGPLQTLNLPGTSIVLSCDISKCTNLKKLSLGGCLFLNTKPHLKEHAMLEVLDLSYTSVKQQNSSKNDNPNKVLSLEELEDDLKGLTKLTSLDLRGLEVKEFPYWIFELVHLQILHLPDLASIQSIDWGKKIKHLPDELNWEECGIFKKASIDKASARPSISMSSTKILQLLKQQSEIWKNCFGAFRIYVCPSAKSGKDEDIYRLRDKSFFEEIYFKNICCPESSKRFLEIRGFKNRPEVLEDALDGVDCLSFIDDEFITSLSDLGAENIKAMTSLWLERCARTEFIFSEGEAPELGDGFSLLWASNLPNLKSLYKGNVQDQCFKNLTQLYIDCCPMLEYVFSSSQLPEKLEKLQVKFCDKLKTLLKSESSASQCELQNLSELHLLELPELTTVGVKLPSLRNAKVKGCPKLEKQEFIHGLGLRSKKVEVTSVEENWERGAPKETKEYPFDQPVNK